MRMQTNPMAWLLAAAALPFGTLAGTAAAQDERPLRNREGALRVAEPDAAERELRMTPEVRAVQRAADSVVSIYIQNAQLLSGEGRRPVTEGQGSGVILDENGFVI